MPDLPPPIKAPTDQPRLIPIVYGDWSGDGGGATTREYVWSNKGIAEWRAAFAAGSKSIGFDLTQRVAADCDSSKIRDSDLAKLRASGFKKRLREKSNGKSTSIDCDEFISMFFYVIKVGDPAISYTPIENGTHRMEIHPGGYGIFGSY